MWHRAEGPPSGVPFAEHDAGEASRSGNGDLNGRAPSRSLRAMSTSSDPEDGPGADTPARRLLVALRGRASAGAFVVLACLAVTAGLTWLARDHWFFADDWTFITRSGPEDLNLLLEPLNGHWMGITAVLFSVARTAAGLDSYLPFVVPAIVAHVLVGFLLWRWQLRDGVRPWLAALVVLPFLVYGAASENVFFAVNVGFNLSLALGIAFALLIEPRDRSRARLAAASAVALLAVPTSTPGPVLIAIVAAWLLWRGDRTGLLLGAGPALAAYGAWLLVAEGGTGLTGGDPADLATFIGSLTASAAGRLVAMPTRGWALAVLGLVAVGAVLATRGRDEGPGGPRGLTWTLAIAGIGFAAATALARVQFGVETWRSPRYAYVVAALLLPLIGVALDRLSRGPAPLTIGTVALLAASTWINGDALLEAHRAEAGLEQHLERRWIAAGQLLEEGLEPIPINVDRYWSPNLHTDHLQDLIAAGDFPNPAEPLPDPWRLEARIELRSVLHGPSPFDQLSPPQLAATDGRCLDLAPQEATEITVAGPAGLEFAFERPTLARLQATTASGRTVAIPRILHLRTPSPRVFWIGLDERTTFQVTVDGGARICALRTEDIGRYAGTEPG